MALAVVVAIAHLAFAEWRLWQGIDLFGKSFYLAVPYRFGVGAGPLVMLR